MSVILGTPKALEILLGFAASRGADTNLVIQHIDEILGKYLRTSLPASIKIKWPDSMRGVSNKMFLQHLTKYCAVRNPTRLLSSIEGWGDARGTTPWEERAKRWYVSRERETLGLEWNEEKSKFTLTVVASDADMLKVVPVYLSSLDIDNIELQELTTSGGHVDSPVWMEEPKAAGASSTFKVLKERIAEDDKRSFYVMNTSTLQLPTETNTMTTKAITIPTAFTAAVEQNKEALQLAAKLSVGKTANAFLVDALTSKLPWYAKLFGQKQAIKDNPLTKVATAQLANLLAQHFAQGNAKVTYVADAMLQEAMVDLITNADIVNDLITKLGSFAGDLTGDTVK